ncbi:hypothetical protein AWC13_00055 [Mycobacterium kubicae]|nr:hypothetical protein AWC13_00055 [Mycobacterium kubicae]
MTDGDTCALCAAGKAPPRFDPAPTADTVPEPDAELVDLTPPVDHLVDHAAPEPASIPEPPPTITQPTTRSAGGHLSCAACQRRFGRRATVVVFGPPDVPGALVVCQLCATDADRHRALFPGCGRYHAARDHGGQHVTAARARALHPTSTLFAAARPPQP